jgi:predicted nucleotidyltransferase
MQLIERILGSKTKIALLRILSRHNNWEYSIAELSKDVNLDKSLISRTIKDLEKDNVVKTFIKGNNKLCRINKKNKIVRDIVIDLFDKESEIVEDISNTLIKKIVPKNFPSISSLFIYGSLVKGGFTPRSDIDIMVIIKDNTGVMAIKKKLEEVSSVFMKDDLMVTFDVITEKEFKELFSNKEPTIIDIVKSNKLLYGKDVRDIV